MQEMGRTGTSFSGPIAPVMRRSGRLPGASRKLGAAVPKNLIAAERTVAARGRRRKIQAVAGSAGKVSVEQRLVQRITMGQNTAEMARVAQMGYEDYLEYQLDYEAIDDSEVEELLAEAFPTLRMSVNELIRNYEGNQGAPVFELIAATMLRALYSPRQLFERMTHFWTDHLNIHLFAEGQPLMKPADHREVVRRHALGKFPDMLSASAHSPSMLVYLTNDSNVRGNPNENYARELMELHSVGVDNGYTQNDVREVARCFTGWGIERGFFAAGPFAFHAGQHDSGTKRVMKRTIPSGGGIEDGERVLEILSNSKRTARYVASKMLVYFWGYEPSRKDVNKVANAYMKTGGDIKAMLRQVLRKGRMQKAEPKLKRPFHLYTSAMRGLYAEVGDLGHSLDFLFESGHVPFNWEPPNGYPDSEAFWSGYILPRWNWAATFLNQRGGRVDLDLPFVGAGLTAKKIADNIDAYLFNGAMTVETRDSLLDFLTSGKKIDKNRIYDAIGLAVASPDFQEY